MWPELCARKLVTSPVTQTRPSSFSSRRLTCEVNSLTVRTRRDGSLGNNSPKSHCDLVCLLIEIATIKPRIEPGANKEVQARRFNVGSESGVAEVPLGCWATGYSAGVGQRL